MTGKIVTVTQQKGGSGKTTIAAHLAVASSRLHYRTVAIVDTDPQGSLGRWFMARSERSSSARPEMGFRTASAWGARYEAQDLAKDYDIVIIDTPPKMGIDGRPAIETADLIVVPVAPSPVDLWATEPTIEMAQSAKKPALMVLNRANARARLTGEMATAFEELGAVAAKTMIGNRIIFASSMGCGSTALEAQSNGPAASEVGDVTHEVMNALGPFTAKSAA